MVKEPLFPEKILNWISGRETPAQAGFFEKRDPRNGKVLLSAARSGRVEVEEAVGAARRSQVGWAATPGVARGEILTEFALNLRKNRQRVAEIASAETGKSVKAALAETDASVSLALFFAGEGQRLYGRTTTSGVAHRSVMTIRQPIGVAALIVAANTPIANVAWKIFPALVCGNCAVVKAAEDAPATAWIFGKIAHESALPAGVLNIIQGFGQEAGEALVKDPGVGLISFTGSTQVGRRIAVIAGERLAKVSLELGGKNPLVVCDDADLEKAVQWAALSAFSNAGQRCASASRIIIFEKVYDAFRSMLVERTKKLKVGPADDDDLGPVINEGQLLQMIKAVEEASKHGAVVLTGGRRLSDAPFAGGYYMAPTVIEHARADDAITTQELFGPITVLYKVKDFEEALRVANDTRYGLTAAIHTKNLHRAVLFSEKAQAGVVSVNAGTFGSEPHLPFGGVKQSGNGSREPGTEALDVYSQLKNIYLNVDPEKA